MSFITPEKPEWAKQLKLDNAALAKQKATDKQWELFDIAVRAFISRYPRHWFEFQRQLNAERSRFNVAKEGGLKQANFRNTAAFPIVYGEYPETGEIIEIDSLKPVLERIIPGLTHKHSANFAEFLRRYPAFRPSEKTTAGSYNETRGVAPLSVKTAKKPEDTKNA